MAVVMAELGGGDGRIVKIVAPEMLAPCLHFITKFSLVLKLLF